MKHLLVVVLSLYSISLLGQNQVQPFMLKWTGSEPGSVLMLRNTDTIPQWTDSLRFDGDYFFVLEDTVATREWVLPLLDLSIDSTGQLFTITLGDQQVSFVDSIVTQAQKISIVDAGGYYPIDNVEAALQELGEQVAFASDGVVNGGSYSAITDTLTLTKTIGADVKVFIPTLNQNDFIDSLAFTGTDTKALTLYNSNGSTIFATFSDNNTQLTNAQVITIVRDSSFITNADEIDPIWTTEKNQYYTKVESDNRFLQEEVDGDSLNEIQVITFNTPTNEISLSKGGGDIDISAVNTDDQTLSWNGSNGTLSITDGNNVDLDGRYLQTESDPTVNNNVITLQRNGSSIGDFTLNQGTDEIFDFLDENTQLTANQVRGFETDSIALSALIDSSATIRDDFPVIGNGTINFRRNNVSIGSITTNQSGGATINFSDIDTDLFSENKTLTTLRQHNIGANQYGYIGGSSGRESEVRFRHNINLLDIKGNGFKSTIGNNINTNYLEVRDTTNSLTYRIEGGTGNGVRMGLDDSPNDVFSPTHIIAIDPDGEILLQNSTWSNSNTGTDFVFYPKGYRTYGENGAVELGIKSVPSNLPNGDTLASLDFVLGQQLFRDTTLVRPLLSTEVDGVYGNHSFLLLQQPTSPASIILNRQNGVGVSLLAGQFDSQIRVDSSGNFVITSHFKDNIIRNGTGALGRDMFVLDGNAPGNAFSIDRLGQLQMSAYNAGFLDNTASFLAAIDGNGRVVRRQVGSLPYLQTESDDLNTILSRGNISSDRVIISGAGDYTLRSSVSDMTLGVQDGNGRIQMYWNANKGANQTYITSNEAAGFWQFDPAVPGRELFSIDYAAGGTSGSSINWRRVLSIGTTTFEWLGNDVATQNWVTGRGYLTSEVDGSVSNELQTLGLTGNTLSITDGNTVDLSGYLDNTDTQLTESEVDAFVSNNGYLTAEVDGSVSNELQTLGLTGNTLSITDGNTVDLSGYLDNTDTQLTESEVDAFVSNNGYLTAEVDGSVSNELQTLGLTGNTLSITDGNTVDLSGYLDNTDTQLTESEVDAFVSNNGYLTAEVDGSVSNELQTLGYNDLLEEIEISGGNIIDVSGIKLTENEVKAIVDNQYIYEEVGNSNLVSSRAGGNYITNGQALMGNNYNFSQFQTDFQDVFFAPASFVIPSKANFSIDELIAINPNLTYELSVYMKQENNDPSNRQRVGFSFLDADKQPIQSYQVYRYAGTETFLTSDLQDGDTEIFVNDVSNWSASVAHRIGFFPYINSFGFEYENYSYTRNTSSSNDPIASIDVANNKIILSSPYQGATLTSGTELAQMRRASNNAWAIGVSFQITDDWVLYSGKLNGLSDNFTPSNNLIFPATAFVKISTFSNVSGTANNAVKFCNFSLKEVVDVDWNDVQNTPTIPTNNNQLTNGAGYLSAVPSEFLTETEGDGRYLQTETQTLQQVLTQGNNANGQFITNLGRLDFLTGSNLWQVIPTSTELGFYSIAGGTYTMNETGTPALGTDLVDKAYLDSEIANVSVTETDPQVGSNVSNGIPRWNGSELVSTENFVLGGVDDLNLNGTSPIFEIRNNSTSGLANTAINLRTGSTTTRGGYLNYTGDDFSSLIRFGVFSGATGYFLQIDQAGLLNSDVEQVQFSEYSTMTKEAADLSKTELGAWAVWADDGTVLQKEYEHHHILSYNMAGNQGLVSSGRIGIPNYSGGCVISEVDYGISINSISSGDYGVSIADQDSNVYSGTAGNITSSFTHTDVSGISIAMTGDTAIRVIVTNNSVSGSATGLSVNVGLTCKGNRN